jgi:DNA repair protein RecO (recombination protein O)
MRYVKTDGIVIKQVNVDEADKILTIFTRKLGKIQVLSKGARKPKNRFMSCSQLFCYADFGMSKSQDMYVLKSAELNKTFIGIGANLDKLGAATFICDVILKIIENETVNLTLLRLALNTIYMISEEKEDESIKKYLIVFMIRFLDIAGVKPTVDRCVKCNDKHLDINKLYFSAKAGGVVCNKCQNENSNYIKLSASAYKAMVFILFTIDKNMFGFNISTGVADELFKIFSKYYEYHFDIKFSSLDFIVM